MDEELKCPMKLISSYFGRCEKEKCAWWRQLDNCCAVWLIAKCLDDVQTKIKR